MTAADPLNLAQLHRILDGVRRRLSPVEHSRDGLRDFGDIDVSVGRHRDTVGRRQLVRLLALTVVAKLGLQAAVEAVDADPWSHRSGAVPKVPKAPSSRSRPPGRTQFADVAK